MPENPPIKPANPRLVSRREAAGHLGVGFRQLDELIRDGVLRAIRIGRFVKIPTAELDRFIAEQPDYRPGRVA